MIGLEVTMDGLTDLASVRAFAGLQRLTSFGTLNGSARDLGPLRGLPLRRLDLFGNSELTDLTPLAGMKLERLNLWGRGGSDLTPLKGMPLKWLNCAGQSRPEQKASDAFRVPYATLHGTARCGPPIAENVGACVAVGRPLRAPV